MPTRAEIVSHLQSLEAEFDAALRRVDAARALALVDLTVKERTQRGEFLEGSTPGSGQYSTTPFVMPAGGLSARAKEYVATDEESDYFETKGGKLWAYVAGGYRALRQAEGYQVAHVDLLRSGAMLDATRAESSYQDGALGLTYGYLPGSDATATKIARFHQVEGAGRGKTKRVFIGLTEAETDKIVAVIEADFASRLA